MRRRAQTVSLLTVLCALLPAANARAATLSISPQPYAPDASPTTQISILGASVADIGTVKVTGSSSGRHGGKLEQYSTATGASFVPDKPFTPGETVHVGIRGAAATTHLSFTVAQPAKTGGAGAPVAPEHRGAFGFVTRPDLYPPRVAITTRASGASAGDVFLAAIVAPGQIDMRTGLPQPQPTRPPMFGQYGPALYDASGNLVWFDPSPPGLEACDFRPQLYRGSPVLTWWQGQVTATGIGSGVDYVVDSSYRPVATVRAGNGYSADLHDFVISPHGSGWLTAYAPVAADLSSVGGDRAGVLLDSVVQEVDIPTGLVMFEWHGDGHVPFGDSHAGPPPGRPWDAYHVNSIQVLPSGNVVVSARQTWAAYDVSTRSGRMLWTLGGRHSTYHLGSGVQFAWQHDAELHPDGTLSVFDDEAAPVVAHASRAELIALDARHRVATLARDYSHSKPSIVAGSQGNADVEPNGNVFVGWGAAPWFTEYSPGGAVLLDGHLHGADESYRAFEARWTGTPAYPPALAARGAGHHAATLYASWNGATEVARWQPLAGPDPNVLAPAGPSVAKSGFETSFSVQSSGPYYAVQALSASGAVLASSPVVSGG